MKATKKPVNQMDLSSLGLDASPSAMEVTELSCPPEKAEGRIIPGDDPKQLAQELVKMLREEAKVL